MFGSPPVSHLAAPFFFRGLPPSQLRIGIVYAMWNQYFVREPREVCEFYSWVNAIFDLANVPLQGSEEQVKFVGRSGTN